MSGVEAPVPPSPPVLVRGASPGDVAGIADLERRALGLEAWSVQAVTEELRAPGRHALVATRGTALVGYAVARVVDEVADLQRVVVDGSARRCGVATRLVQEQLTRVRAAGACRVLLEVSAGNHAARALYAALGFAGIDRRARYYRDGSDALVLQLGLDERTEECR